MDAFFFCSIRFCASRKKRRTLCSASEKVLFSSVPVGFTLQYMLHPIGIHSAGLKLSVSTVKEETKMFNMQNWSGVSMCVCRDMPRHEMVPFCFFSR